MRHEKGDRSVKEQMQRRLKSEGEGAKIKVFDLLNRSI
jgi:hypothetical protein